MEDYRSVFKKQRANRWNVAQSTAAQRIEKLKKLRGAIMARREELQRAIFEDFRKNPGEVDLTEVFPTISEINHTIRHLKRWMKPVRVGTPLALFGTRSEVRYEPKGLVLILSPWNYPFQLLINPLVATIAAGNCAILKPSSKVPHTAHFLMKFISETFDESEIALFEGSSALSDALLELPFDHIFFTGSPRIGKTVMQAAAQHFASVTLELGGKSPVIVDASADLRKTAERLLWGKFINAGQTCVAPDYLLIHESRLQGFVEEARKVLSRRFGDTEDQRKQSRDFCRLVSKGHHEGLMKVLTEAIQSGAKVAIGGVSDPEQRYLSPTLLVNVSEDSPIMKEEIFGPILPVITFSRLEEALEIIQRKEKPLALYIFSEDRRAVELIMKNTTAGGTCVNSTVIHLANHNLPFGGIGQSGMGNYHGFFGFRNLSHERAVLCQGPFDVLKQFYPPYTERVKKLIQMATRFLS
ncbi:MAG: aldehyde dehydrogenase family protein [Acidobacteria bacterium]|nr:aldehyde dehydrogenase family protein [Acidobacteriota bacterium]MBI3655648.1 aldehyde dehydrogenase family protein [Acidobacteriota bacterium]